MKTFIISFIPHDTGPSDLWSLVSSPHDTRYLQDKSHQPRELHNFPTDFLLYEVYGNLTCTGSVSWRVLRGVFLGVFPRLYMTKTEKISRVQVRSLLLQDCIQNTCCVMKQDHTVCCLRPGKTQRYSSKLIEFAENWDLAPYLSSSFHFVFFF